MISIVEWNGREHLARVLFFLRRLAIGLPLGIVVGSVVRLFLWSLNRVTDIRWMSTLPGGLPWLLYFLPIGGVIIALLYGLWGEPVVGGNNLIVDEIHEPGGGVPLRMTPLVLIGDAYHAPFRRVRRPRRNRRPDRRQLCHWPSEKPLRLSPHERARS